MKNWWIGHVVIGLLRVLFNRIAGLLILGWAHLCGFTFKLHRDKLRMFWPDVGRNSTCLLDMDGYIPLGFLQVMDMFLISICIT